ncbi:MAG: recombinase family protein [Verrucomicrobia bacterium]|nr:recombinase family protein [Verrucomicrobiota bacterium]
MSITNKLPGWLDGKTGEPIVANEEKSKVVRRIFEMAAGGVGKRLIARRFNEERVPTFGGGKRNNGKWIQSYIHKILNNRAALGEYQPRKASKLDGDARLNFFPAVIDHALFQRAQEALASRRTNKLYGRTGKISNLFTSLIFETSDNSPLYYVDKGRRAVPQLSNEKTGKERRIRAGKRFILFRPSGNAPYGPEGEAEELNHPFRFRKSRIARN